MPPGYYWESQHLSILPLIENTMRWFSFNLDFVFAIANNSKNGNTPGRCSDMPWYFWGSEPSNLGSRLIVALIPGLW